MEKVQPKGFHHLLKRTSSYDNRRKIHHSSSPKTVKNGAHFDGKGLETSNINENTSPHRFVKLLIVAVNKMHDTKIMHEKVSEYNLALILCHKINVLFTVQQTFVDAENLAVTMYSEQFANCIVDVLIEGGDLAYIPGQLLLYLTMNDKCVEYLLKDDIIAIICGVLRVGERRFSTIGIAIFRNLADLCQSKVAFASKMRSRTTVLKLMVQRFVNELYVTSNNNDDDEEATINKTMSDDDNHSIDSSIVEHINGNNDTDIYSFYNTNAAMEILILIEFIISVTTSRSHIDELRDIVNEAISTHKTFQEIYEEEEQNNLRLNTNIEEMLKKAYKISEGANRRKHHVTKDVDYEKANKSRRRDGYAAANI